MNIFKLPLKIGVVTFVYLPVLSIYEFPEIIEIGSPNVFSPPVTPIYNEIFCGKVFTTLKIVESILILPVI